MNAQAVHPTVDVLVDKVHAATDRFFAQAADLREITAQLERAAATELVRRNDATLAGQRERRVSPPRPYTGPERRQG